MVIHNEDGRTRQSTVYSWKTGAVDVAGSAGGTNITTITPFANLFKPFADATPSARRPRYIKIESTGNVYVKINGGDVITIGATTPFTADDLVINSVSISSGGASQTVTILLL